MKFSPKVLLGSPEFKRKSSIVLFAVLPILTFVMGYGVSHYEVVTNMPFKDGIPRYEVTFNGEEGSTAKVATAVDSEVDMNQFWQVYKLLKQKFYRAEGGVDAKEAALGATEGMVKAVGDRHTVFMRKQQSDEFQHELQGELEGIGAELTVKDGVLEVVTVLKDSPAKRAGLLPGDFIFKIEDEFSADLLFFDAIRKIRGPKGSTVNLTIQRELTNGDSKLKGRYDLVELAIIRDLIEIDSVEWEEKGEGVVLLSINTFSADTVEEFQKAIKEIEAFGPKGLILDLRYNPGGYLNAAVAIASEFVEEGVIVSRRSKAGRDEDYAFGNATFPHIPMVVLVNKGSASASEIVSGALQDYERATVIGESSYGKGTVQEPFTFQDGTFLKVTTANWYTPKDRSIDEVGIEPDIEVKMTMEDRKEDRDPQMDKAIEVMKEKLSK